MDHVLHPSDWEIPLLPPITSAIGRWPIRFIPGDKIYRQPIAIWLIAMDKHKWLLDIRDIERMNCGNP
jgi:hypothetical protein